ncbi:MAG: hypothetical protein D6730_24775 [Bacteroidetes bacterium]|nr:MAG: hypothetical protein D6730_24775 [Bacteroidota bacterium]
MYKEVLRTVEGITEFPVLAILIFFVFFLILLVYVVKLDKGSVRHYAHIPLEGDEDPRFVSPQSDSKP